jgi:hypothetical protein
MITGAWDRFWVAVLLLLAVMGLLEFARLTRVRRLPWWIAHGPVLAWSVVALVPWFVALRAGVWTVPAVLSTVPLGLPTTYGFGLVALIGLACGIAPFALWGRRAGSGGPPPPLAATRIVPRRAFAVCALLFALYVVSLPSPSSLWRLTGASGDNMYGRSQGSFLSLSLLMLTVIGISYLARRQPLSGIGIGLYLALVVVTLGSAQRYLFISLIVSYLVLRHPLRRIPSSLTQLLVLLLVGGATVWLVGFAGIGQLSILRSGQSTSSASLSTQETLRALDVMGSAEFLLEAGARPGQLHGSSYLALLREFVPRALLGSRATPPAVRLEQNELGPTGSSAPLWIEGVLNFGALGDLLSMAVVAAAWGLLLRRAVCSRDRLGRAAAAIGPVWVLFAYQALSRILMLAAIELVVSIVISLWMWNWMQEDTQPARTWGNRRSDQTSKGAGRQPPALSGPPSHHYGPASPHPASSNPGRLAVAPLRPPQRAQINPP